MSKFEEIMSSNFPVISNTYSKQDMDRLYESVIYECMKVTRNHILAKFGIPDEFAGTTEIENVIGKHFGVKQGVKHG